jgi:hypothetical protein
MVSLAGLSPHSALASSRVMDSVAPSWPSMRPIAAQTSRMEFSPFSAK